jgi:hypothetical protein
MQAPIGYADDSMKLNESFAMWPGPHFTEFLYANRAIAPLVVLGERMSLLKAPASWCQIHTNGSKQADQRRARAILEDGWMEFQQLRCGAVDEPQGEACFPQGEARFPQCAARVQLDWYPAAALPAYDPGSKAGAVDEPQGETRFPPARVQLDWYPAADLPASDHHDPGSKAAGAKAD